MKSVRPVLLLALVLWTGCAAPYRAYQGPRRPPNQVAVIRLDSDASRLSFGHIDGVQLSRFVREIRVLPGAHSIQVLGYQDTGPFGVHLLEPQAGTLSVTVIPGHAYVVKATGTNVGSRGIAPWVEDKATKEVVAGKKSYGGRF